MDPIECMTREMTVDNGDSFHHCTYRRPLDEGDHGRPDGKSPVPQPARVLSALAELEGDAAKDQAEEHQQHRKIERAEKHRIDRRERRKETCPDDHQPCFVAIPERRNGVEHLRSIGLVACESEQHSHTEIEPVQDDVDQDRQSDQEREDRGQERCDEPAGALVERHAARDRRGIRLGVLLERRRRSRSFAHAASLRLPPVIAIPTSSSLTSGGNSATMRPS